jgi:YVTN family beta-propeller protein
LGARFQLGTNGTISLPSNAIIASGDGTGANGSITILAGAPNVTSISSGAIETNQGTGTAGDITIATAKPIGAGGFTITFDTHGNITAGGPIVAGVLQPSNILLTSDASSGIGVVSVTSGANVGNVTMTAGGNITTSTILGGANVTMTSGGSVPSDGNANAGINLLGYGILSPGANITLTTTGTGDIRGQTRLVTTLPLATTQTSMSVLLPNGQFVYASDGNNIDVFSTATYSQVGAAIPVGTNPFMGVFSPSSGYLYVTNSGSGSVSVISTGANTVTTTIPVGNTPQGIAVTPSGQFVYVANNGSDSISVINTATNRLVGTISLAGSGVTNPTGIAINTSLNLAYVSDSASNTIAVINTRTNSFTGTTISLPAGATNASLTYMPAGTLLYAAVATGPSAGTYSIDTTTNTVSGNVLPAGQTVNFYPQGTVGLITAGSSGTFRFDTVLGTGRTFGVNTTGGFGSPVGTVPNSFNGGEFQGVNYQAFLPMLGTNAIAAFQTASVVGGKIVLASNSGNIFINTLTPTLTAYSGGDSTKQVFISQIGSVTLTPATVDVGGGPMIVNSGVGGTFQLGSSPYNGFPANISVSTGNPNAAVTASTVYLFTPTGNIGTPSNPLTLSTIPGQQLSLLVTAEGNVSGIGNVYLSARGNDVSGSQPAVVLNEVSVGGQTAVDATSGNFVLRATQGGIGVNAVVSATTSDILTANTNVDIGAPLRNGNVTVLAADDITFTGNGQVQINSTTSTPFNVTMVAGAKITPIGSNTNVDFSQGNGGDINFSGSTVVGPVINTAGTPGTGGAGGDVVLAARANGVTGGNVALPSSAIDASGDGTGANGNVTIIAGAVSGTSINTGAISTNQGTGTAGNITLTTAQPTATGGTIVSFDTQGGITFGGPIAPSSLENGNILLTSDASSGIGVVSVTSGRNAGNITFTAGGNITTSTVLGGANVTMTSGGSVPSDGNANAGINLLGYGILSPGANVTLTTNGAGDIRGQTRLVTTLPLVTSSTSMSVLLPNGQFVYASDGNNVDVFSTATYSQVGAAIPVGTNPFMGVYSSNSNDLYVTNSGSNNVSVINTGSNTVVATIAVGSNPRGVAATPNGQLVFVANNVSDTVSVIDTSTNLVVTTISLVGSGVTNPTGIAINTSQNLAYVSDSSSNTIAVINTQTNTFSGTTISLPAGALNASLTFNPAGNLLYAAVAVGPSAGTYSFNTTTNTLQANVLPAGQSVNFYPQGTVGLITAGIGGTFRFDSVLGTGRFFGVNTTAGFGSPVGTVPNSFNAGEFQGVNYQAFLPLLGTNAVAAFQTASVVGGRVILASNSGNIFINTLTPTLTAYSGGDSTKGVFISQIGTVTLSPATVDVGGGPITVNSGVGGIFQLGSSPYNGIPASIFVASGNPAPALTATTVYLLNPTGNIGTPTNPFTLSTVSGQQLSLLVTAEANVSGLGNVYLSARGNDLSASQAAVVLNEVSVGGQTPVDATTGNFVLNATQGGIGFNAVVFAGTSATLGATTNLIQQGGAGVVSQDINLSTVFGDIGSAGTGAIATSNTVSMTINAGGNAYINQTGAFTLNSSSVGGTFQLNSTGSVTIGGLVTSNASMAILANGDITATANGQIETGWAAATAANLLMVAGALVTPTGNTLVIDFSQGNGGNIDFTGSTVVGPVLNAAGEIGTGSPGGDVVLAARSNLGTGGNVALPSNAINASGDGAGANGNITIIAGAATGTSIRSGAIERPIKAQVSLPTSLW